MASVALPLDSFLDLPLPVHSKFPTVTVVSKVLWCGGPSPLDHSNSGLRIPFLTTSSCRWLMGLLCGTRPDVVHWFNKVNIKLRFFELIQCHPGCLVLGLVFSTPWSLSYDISHNTTHYEHSPMAWSHIRNSLKITLQPHFQGELHQLSDWHLSHWLHHTQCDRRKLGPYTSVDEGSVPDIAGPWQVSSWDVIVLKSLTLPTSLF